MENKEDKEGSLSKSKLVSGSAEGEASLEAQAKKHSDDEDVDIEVSSEDSDSDSRFVCDACHKKFSGLIPFKQHRKSGSHAKAIQKMKMKKKMEKEIKSGKNKSDDDDDDEYFLKQSFAVCEPCGKEFSGIESYVSHLSSKNHKRKLIEVVILKQVKENGEINVDKLKKICNRKMASEKSSDGTSDLYKELLENIETEFASGGEGDSDAKDEPDDFECKDCEKVFSGLIPFMQHFLSKTHRKKLEEKKYLEKVKSENYEKLRRSSFKDGSDISTLEVVDDILTCKICNLSFNGSKNAFAHLKSQGHSKKHKLYTWRLFRLSEPQDASSVGSGSEDGSNSTDILNATLDAQTRSSTEKGLNMTADQNDLSESAGETVAQPAAKGDSSVEETISTYKRYKEYKKLMNELRDENKK